MKRSALAPILLVSVGTILYSLAQTQNQPSNPARSRSEEMLDSWNGIGNKLVAMAQDFPRKRMTSRCRRTSAPLR